MISKLKRLGMTEEEFTQWAKEEIINSNDKRAVASIAEKLVANVIPGVTMASGSTRGRNCSAHDVEYGDKIGDVKIIVPHTSQSHERVNHCDKYQPDFVVYVRVNTEDRTIAIYDTIDNEPATRVLSNRDTITFNTNLEPNHKDTKQNINTRVIKGCRVTVI